MKTDVKTSTNNLYSFLWIIPVIIFALLIFVQLYKTLRYSVISPLEVREGVGFKYALDFSKGKNPYSLSILSEDAPPAINHYGLIMTLFLSLFIRFSPNYYIVIIRFVTFVVRVLGCFFFAKGLAVKTNNKLLAAISVFFVYALYQFPSYPCTWALTLSFLLYWIIAVDYKKNNCRWYLYVMILILLFYTKQYFVLLAAGVLIYILIEKPIRNALKYVLLGVILGGTSMLIVNKIFPLYFTQSFLFVGTTSSSSRSIPHLKEQISSMFYSLFGGLFVLLIGAVITLFVLLIKSKKIKDESTVAKEAWHLFSYGIIMFAVMAPALCYLGQNTGSTNRYFYELWIPYLLDVALCFVDFVCRQKADTVSGSTIYYTSNCITSAILIFSCIVLSKSFYHPYFLDKNGYEQWQQVYQLVDEYAPSGNMFSSSVLSFYCMDHDVVAYDYGSNEYCNENIRNDITGGYKTKLFPYATELNEKVIEERNNAYEKISNGEFDLVVLTDGLPYYSGLQDNLNSGGYIEVDTQDLNIGGRKWTTHFYARE